MLLWIRAILHAFGSGELKTVYEYNTAVDYAIPIFLQMGFYTLS